MKAKGAIESLWEIGFWALILNEDGIKSLLRHRAAYLDQTIEGAIAKFRRDFPGFRIAGVSHQGEVDPDAGEK